MRLHAPRGSFHIAILPMPADSGRRKRFRCTGSIPYSAGTAKEFRTAAFLPLRLLFAPPDCFPKAAVPSPALPWGGRGRAFHVSDVGQRAKEDTQSHGIPLCFFCYPAGNIRRAVLLLGGMEQARGWALYRHQRGAREGLTTPSNGAGQASFPHRIRYADSSPCRITGCPRACRPRASRGTRKSRPSVPAPWSRR